MDKVTDHIDQAALVEQSLDHGVQRIDAILFDHLITSDLTPWVEEIILAKDAADLVVHSIRDHTEGMVFHQLWDVASIADRELFVGLEKIRFLTDRTFELKHHQRNAIDVENAVRDTLFLTEDL